MNPFQMEIPAQRVALEMLDGGAGFRMRIFKGSVLCVESMFHDESIPKNDRSVRDICWKTCNSNLSVKY